MTLDPDEFFDEDTLASLRGLRRDRKLTIGGGARPWGMPADDTGVELSHFVACVDLDAKRVLSGSAALAEEWDGALVAMLLQAMLQPDEPARPRLPRRVIVEDQAIAHAIERPLRRLGVEVAVAPVRVLDGVIETMRATVESWPAWFRAVDAALPLFQAAASMWAAAPWDLLPDELASATIELKEPVNRTLHAMSAGAGELGSVLFCVSDAGLERMLELSETSSEGDPDDADPLGEHDSIENYDGLIVSYSDADEAEDGEIEHLHDKRLPIGSAFAYPRFLRSGEGDRPREIDDDEARLLTLAMDGLARFCLRQRIRLARGETPVRGAVLVRDGDELVVADVRTPAEPRSAQ